ncbi:NAD(P)H-dependent oxidoreductase [Arthrobacter sp. zg-Y877]|uniref:NAD(P)H-dependent oxidoreductase n=1 Tax=Arthrobacter sp. zg-Y877 TaxID=3049074 RepID=UPI0025A4719E|nr:NAD(P)H-dependent oxidoreductase [Arthrobacter sp. zg-Y877]MDM7991340.1 NAD(P)H-dependent oxidoreductase [Arthrobacter sp. zg-Y877]
MSRPLQVAIVNGSPNANSKTMALVSLITDSLGQKLELEVHQTNVYDLGPSFFTAIERETLLPEVEAEFIAVESSDLLIAATPVYRGSYSGMFKHFFDLTGQYALTNKPVILVATGGSDRHALVIEHELRPLFGFFQAATIPVGFYANAGDFEGNLVLNAEVYSRIEIAIGDVIDKLRVLATT